MSYSGSDGWMRSGVALFVAALLAPLVTAFLMLSVLAGSELPLWSVGSVGDLASMAAMLGFIALLLGFPSALVFLGSAFWLARRSTTVRSLMLAGAGAGVAHTVIGLLLRIAILNRSALGDWDVPLNWVMLWGGFILPAAPNVAILAIVSVSAVAGALAGLVYARISGLPGRLRE